MKNAGKQVLVLCGAVASIAVLVPLTTRTLGASPGGDQPPRRVPVDRVKTIDVRKLPELTPTTPATPIPNALAKQRGCRDGGVGDINRTNPSWVSVLASEPVTVVEGIVRKSKVTHEDFPENHESHDWNLDILPDIGYRGLLSDANDIEDGERLMEIEWETKHLPDQFLPAPGDRIWMMGRWIFDCGHPPYRTEIHPPKAMAFSRLEPHTFRGDTAPSFVTKTSVFINGQGGYFYDPIGGLNYQFAVPLPPKPSAAAQARAEVVAIPFGNIQPQLFVEENLNRVRVVYPLAGFRDPSPSRWNLYKNPLSQRPPQNSPRFGAIIASGWREPVITKNYRTYRVNLTSIKINEDHDPLASGEWVMWIRVNGTWVRISGLGDVDDGQTVPINRTVLVTVPDSGSINLQTTGWESDPIDDTFSMSSPGSLPEAGAVDGNDQIGTLNRTYRFADNFGSGAHSDSSTNNDFQLNYRISEVSRVAAGTPNGTGASTRKRVTVTLGTLKVLTNSEPGNFTNGEFYFNITVNNQARRFPRKGEKSLPTNGTTNLGMRFDLVLNQSDTLNIQIRGMESDWPDEDDDMGLVSQNFTFAQNFGAGTRTVRSRSPDKFQVTYSVATADQP